MFVNSQLQPYHTELAGERNRTNLNEPELASAGSLQPHAQSTAAGILGLGRIRRRTPQRTLEAEVQTYLSEPPVLSSSLSYWEVWHNYLYEYYLTFV